MRLRQLLAARGVHYFVTRFGPVPLRSVAFDEKYRCGDWVFNRDGAGELGSVVRRYLRNGDLLMMGCGGAGILGDLEPEEMNSALGIDLSAEAIRLASRYASDRISFLQADMTAFACPKSYDVILFSESLYYVPASGLEALLARLTQHLKPGGVVIATFAQAARHESILERIRQKFAVLEDRAFSGSRRRMIVFQQSPEGE